MSLFFRYGSMKKSAFFILPVLIVSRSLPDAGYCCQALPKTIGATARPYALDNAHRGYALDVFREALPRYAHAARAHVYALASLATMQFATPRGARHLRAVLVSICAVSPRVIECAQMVRERKDNQL